MHKQLTDLKQSIHLLMLICIVGSLILCADRAGAQEVLFENTLMPQPTEVRVSEGQVGISSGLTASLNGATNPLLREATLRMLSRLEAQTGIQLDKNLQMASSPATIDISVQDTSAMRPTLGADESYSLDVKDHKVSLHARTIFGAIHGFETLLQLVQPNASTFVLPAVHIVDAPRFPWRGLMLDPGRRFLPVDEILRTLDAMAAVKMNVLHWHLTEDQGFRIESLRFPRLHELGSDGLYYTK